MLFGNLCLYSLFPCQHLHHSYYNCSLLIGHLPFRFHCSPGNKPLSLSLSVSFLPFFSQSSLLLLLQLLLSALQWGSPTFLILSTISSLHLIFHALHVLSWQLSSNCCPPAFCIVHPCLSSPSLFPHSTCLTTDHFLLLSDFPLFVSLLRELPIDHPQLQLQKDNVLQSQSQSVSQVTT